MTDTLGNSVRNALILAAFAIVASLVLAAAFDLTEETIIQREDEEKLKIVDQILPRDLYDNRVLRDSVQLAPHALLGTDEATIAYRARRGGRVVAIVFEAVAPDGYGGKIRLILAAREDGELLGVRVLAHNETVGWGDYIEIEKKPWIKILDAASLERYTDKQWQVKKDGGRFDFVTRATVSARAIVKAAHRALQYHSKYKSDIGSRYR